LIVEYDALPKQCHKLKMVKELAYISAAKEELYFSAVAEEELKRLV
jgi:hypothetical protein